MTISNLLTLFPALKFIAVGVDIEKKTITLELEGIFIQTWQDSEIENDDTKTESVEPAAGTGKTVDECINRIAECMSGKMSVIDGKKYQLPELVF